VFARTELGIVPAPATVPEKVGLGMVRPEGSVVAHDGTPLPLVMRTLLFAVARLDRTPDAENYGSVFTVPMVPRLMPAR
jgi:hypothetical protein